MKSDILWDILIVGTGPAGMGAAVNARFSCESPPSPIFRDTVMGLLSRFYYQSSKDLCEKRFNRENLPSDWSK